MSETETEWVKAFRAFSRAEMPDKTRRIAMDAINALAGAKDLGQHIATMHPDHEQAEREMLGDDEDDDEIDGREQRKRRNELMKVANAMSHAGLSEDQIAEVLDNLSGGEAVMNERRAFVRDRRHSRGRDDMRGLPRNGIEGGAGGRLADRQRQAQDRRRLALDANRREFEQRWPEAARIGSDASFEAERPIATDSASAADFNTRFPGAARIGAA